MDSFSFSQTYVSAFGAALLVLLIWLMHRRGQRKAFPYFFIYLLVVLLKAETLQIVRSFSGPAYFYGYWIAEAITILLSFGVIFEVYLHVLTSGTLPINRTAFFRIAVTLLLFAGIVAMLTLHGEGYPAMIRTIFALSATLRIVQIGLFALVACFSVFYGLYWTSQAFGIALGYALFALLQLANTLVRASAGSVGHTIYVYASMLGYQCAVLIWLAYALKGKRQIQLNVPDNNTAIWFGALERLAK